MPVQYLHSAQSIRIAPRANRTQWWRSKADSANRQPGRSHGNWCWWCHQSRRRLGLAESRSAGGWPVGIHRSIRHRRRQLYRSVRSLSVLWRKVGLRSVLLRGVRLRIHPRGLLRRSPGLSIPRGHCIQMSRLMLLPYGVWSPRSGLRCSVGVLVRIPSLYWLPATRLPGDRVLREHSSRRHGLRERVRATVTAAAAAIRT